MFVYFTEGTCINDSDIDGVKAKREQSKNNKKAYFPGPIGNKLIALDRLRTLNIIPCIFNGLFRVFPF